MLHRGSCSASCQSDFSLYCPRSSGEKRVKRVNHQRAAAVGFGGFKVLVQRREEESVFLGGGLRLHRRACGLSLACHAARNYHQLSCQNCILFFYLLLIAHWLDVKLRLADDGDAFQIQSSVPLLIVYRATAGDDGVQFAGSFHWESHSEKVLTAIICHSTTPLSHLLSLTAEESRQLELQVFKLVNPQCIWQAIYHTQL